MPFDPHPVATEADISRLYRVLLGRDPETPEVVKERVNRPLLDVVIEITKSKEYRSILDSGFPQLERLVKAIFGANAPRDDWIQHFRKIIATYRIPVAEILDYLLQISEQTEDRLWPAVTEPFGVGMCKDAITVVVPTFNSASWIAELVQAYRDIGIDPLFAVDSRTTDNTVSVLAASDARFVCVASTEPRVEALMPALAASAPTTWILRFDDDELPSGELIRCINGLDLDSAPSVYGFPHCHLRLEGQECLQRSRFIAFGPSADFDRLWRLFRKDRITFDGRLHTPGIVIQNTARAPNAAMILHFDWIIRNHETRLKKFERYRLQCDASARKVRHVAIWEDIPLSWHRFEPVPSERLTAFARRIKGKASEPE